MSHDDLPVGRVLRILAISPLSLNEEHSETQQQVHNIAKMLLGFTSSRKMKITYSSGEIHPISTSPTKLDEENLNMTMAAFIADLKFYQEENFVELLPDVIQCLKAAKNIPYRSFNEAEVAKLEGFYADKEAKNAKAKVVYNALFNYALDKEGVDSADAYKLILPLYSKILSQGSVVLSQDATDLKMSLETAYRRISSFAKRQDFERLLLKDVAVASAASYPSEMDKILKGFREAGNVMAHFVDLSKSSERESLNSQFSSALAPIFSDASSRFFAGNGNNSKASASNIKHASYSWKQLKDAADTYGLSEKKEGDPYYPFMCQLAYDGGLDVGKIKTYQVLLNCVIANEDVPSEHSQLRDVSAAYEKAQANFESLNALAIAEDWSDNAEVTAITAQDLPAYAYLARIAEFDAKTKTVNELPIKKAIDTVLGFYTKHLSTFAETVELSLAKFLTYAPSSTQELISADADIKSIIEYLTTFLNSNPSNEPILYTALNIIRESQQSIEECETYKSLFDSVRTITQENTEWAEEILPMKQQGKEKGKRKACDSTIAECLNAFGDSSRKLFVLKVLSLTCQEVINREQKSMQTDSSSAAKPNDMTAEERQWSLGGLAPVNQGSSSGTSGNDGGNVTEIAKVLGITAEEYEAALAAEQSMGA